MKYLFGDQTPEGMISVSQIQTFLSCRKKWEYNYIDGLRPRVERSYLTIGKLCHKGMQAAMQSIWREEGWCAAEQIGIDAIQNEWNEYTKIVDFLDEELPEVEQMLIDAKHVFRRAFEDFNPWKYKVITINHEPALELHFVVPCRGSKGLHGFIDAILEDLDTGHIWCVDYKFRKSLAPDEDEAFNIQNAVYAYACSKLKLPITGTLTWQHLNVPCSDPQILKNGGVSRSKIKTTWNHYRDFCDEHGIDWRPYEEEMREKLSDIEWTRATYEYRNPSTIKKMWDECVVPVAWEIKKAGGTKAKNFRSLYPWNCKMCQYQSLCQAELRDYDVNGIIEREYITR